MNQSKILRTFALLALVVLSTVGGIIWLGLQLQAIIQTPVGEITVDTANSVAVERVAVTTADQPLTVATATSSVLLAARQSLESKPTPPLDVTATAAAIQSGSQETVGAADAVQRAIVDAPLVNVRSAPSVAGELLIQLPQDQAVEILDISADEAWYQVCCPLGTTAARETWVSADLLRVEPLPTAVALSTTALTSPNADDPQQARINVSLANVRRGPGTGYATLEQIPQTTIVQLSGRTAAGDWVQICCFGEEQQKGWISVELLDFGGERQQVLQTLSISPAPEPPATS